MNAVGGQTCLDNESRPVADHLQSFLQSSKKDEVVFFRMDTPSQLEKEYEFGPVLGEGTFGVVYRGVRRKDQAQCAIKKILRERSFSASERARLDREISILRLVRHPGIIELFAVAESPSILFLVTELCEGGSLAGHLETLKEGTSLEECVAVEIIRQVASALSYLHNRGIIHRDLKAGNIMLLHKVDLRSYVIKRSGQVSRDRTGAVERNNITNTERQTVTQDFKALTAPTVPVITDVHLTENVEKKSAPQSHSTIRSKNARMSSKHSAPISFASPPHVTEKNKQPASVQQKQQQRYQPQQQQEQKQWRPASQTTLPNSAVRVPRIGALESNGSVKSAPSTLRTKLIDFGLAIEVRKNEEVLADPCGTPLYMAPEVLTGRSYTRQCDVWSLGVLMYQLLTNQIPFTAQNEDQLLEQLTKFNVVSVIQPLEFLSNLAQDCLMRVLHTDPAYRYSASELLLDPWITQFGAINQEDPIDQLEMYRRSSQDGQTETSGRASTGLGQPECAFGSRPPSVGFSHSTGAYAATNVLELMKQYHKELTGNKQDLSENVNSTRTS